MFSASDESAARVLIASADACLRKMLMDATAQKAGLKVAGFIRAGRHLESFTRIASPDLLLVDARILETGSTQIIVSLQRAQPKLRIMIYGGDAVTMMRARELKAVDAEAMQAWIFVSSADADAGRAVQSALESFLKSRRQRPATQESGMIFAPVRPPADGSRAICQGPPECLVIASSTGGPVALMSLVRKLPAHFPLPIAVVQHMPPNFTRMLAERLDSSSALQVVEGEAEMELRPGRIIIGPGDFHMRLRGTRKHCRVALDQGEREHSCRPAANVLFRSAAEIFGGNVLTLVLTGMGRDGFEGARDLRALGSRVLVQDAATSTVWGMPGAIAQAGLADAILPLEQIVPELMGCL